MKNSLLIALCLVCTVTAEVNYDVKRGIYPYMAFLYYPDETVLEHGVRFFRDAVLIKPDWLISAAIDHPQGEGFPRKTLLARAGAVTIDPKVTLNEDEDEQEREVIQIVRPTIHDLNIWYATDITLLNTLLPFSITSAVGFYNYEAFNFTISKEEEKICTLLVYARDYENTSDDRRLMQMTVELVVPPTKESCGEQLASDEQMTCAVDTEETKSAIRDPNFCQGNAGGPLICDDHVVAIQTYINFNCRSPHLYQLLSSWRYLVECAQKNSCKEEYCSCYSIDKDPPATEIIVSHTPDTASDNVIGAELSGEPQSVAEITTTTASMATETFSERLESISSSESITTEPHSSTTEPESTTAESESTTTETGSTTTVPEIKTTEPEIKTTEPEIKTTEPEIKTTEPEIKTTEPETSTAEPVITTTKQESTTTTEQTTPSNTPEMTESVTTTTLRTTATTPPTTTKTTTQPTTTKTTTVKTRKTTKKVRTTVSTTSSPRPRPKVPFTAEMKKDFENDAEETGAAVRRTNIEAQKKDQVTRLDAKGSAWSHMSPPQSLLSSVFILAVLI